MDVPTYQHDLGDGFNLDVFAVDPTLSSSDLEMFVRKKDGEGNLDLDRVSQFMSHVDTVDGFGDMTFEALEGDYEIPGALKPYRHALGIKLDAVRKPDGSKQFKNGTIAVIASPHGRNVRFRRGGYYDFQATQYIDPLTKQEAIPGDLLPDIYPSGKTLRELMSE